MKVFLIKWHWHCYQLTHLVSNFFRNLLKISQSLIHFRIFITNKKEGAPQFALRFFPSKKKINQSNIQACTHKALLCHVYTIMFFDVFSHFLKCSICHIWEGNDCIACVKPMVRNCNKFKILIKMLWIIAVEKLTHPFLFKLKSTPHLSFFFLLCLFSMLATVTLLIVGCYWNKFHAFQYQIRSIF